MKGSDGEGAVEGPWKAEIDLAVVSACGDKDRWTRKGKGAKWPMLRRI